MLDKFKNLDFFNNCIFQVTGAELVECINHFLTAKEQKSKTEPRELLYTREETASRLNISLPTLNKYDKKGIIKSVRIGNRILYTESAIVEALKKRR
jgi:hypothetical protein